jgi:uncharacterized repeat protein (TIGR03803 family)
MKMTRVVCLSLLTVVASLSPGARAQTFSVIHSFTGSEGSMPYAGVSTRGGALYGTALFGGVGNGSTGTVYEITHLESNWITMPITFFANGGAQSSARVLFGPDGHLYGTTDLGGSHNAGIVFQLTPPLSICKTASCPWKETVLHEFQGGADGANPGPGDLAWDHQGNIYGTTPRGGTGGLGDLGTVYQLQPSGNGWQETVIYDFSGPDGQNPYSGVMVDNNGNLFGTTARGGLYGFGTVFELKYVPGVSWTETTIYNFQNGSDGASPAGGLVSDSSGNLYGTTAYGGESLSGTAFELSFAGDAWKFTKLYTFTSGGAYHKGCGPRTTLTMDVAGNLYGTTLCGGTYAAGSVFKLTHTENGWTYALLREFVGFADGKWSYSNVTIDADGTLYGTTSEGGAQGLGVVWMITP